MDGTDVPVRWRRWIAAVLTIGVAAGVATGVALRSPALRPARVSTAPVLLHSARAFAIPGRPLQLEVAAFCAEVQDPERCRLRSGTIHIEPAGARAVDLPGVVRDDRVRFDLPASVIGAQGFRYSIAVEDVLGQRSLYPPDGDATLQVRSTAGLREIRLPTFSWRDTLAGEPLVELPYGAAPGEVGIAPAQGDGLASGESSFDVGPTGELYIADRVNRRIQVLDPDGRYRSELPLPDQRAVDIAVSPSGEVFTATLGDAAQVSRIQAAGAPSTVAVPFGVVARLRVGAEGPMAVVGDAQYLPVPVGGATLGAAEQAQRIQAGPPSEGRVTSLTGPVGDHTVAATWTDPDGAAHGALLHLPPDVFVGSDYFTHPLPDGGAVVAQGLYAPGHNVVGILRLGPTGSLLAFHRLPEPSFRQDARWSTVRWRDPGDVLVIYEDPQGVRIDRFEVI